MANAVRKEKSAPLGLAWAIVIAMALFVVAPQLGLAVYALWQSQVGLTFAGFSSLLENSGFLPSLMLSLIVAALTILILVLILIPAVVAVHLWAPKFKAILNIMCTLPLVVPSIALVAGLLAVLRTLSSQGRGSFGNALSQTVQSDQFPIALVGTYVVLSLPFTYRSVNAAISEIPLRTFYEASYSLGAGTWTTLAKVIVPNIRGSIVFSAFFAFALALGEYTVAATMSYRTLPVFMTTLSATDFRASVSLSLLSNILTWSLLAFAMYYSDRITKKVARKKSSLKDKAGVPGLATISNAAVPADVQPVKD